MTCRCIETRYDEHERHWRLGRSEKSAVAQHMLNNYGHTTDISKLTLVQEVTQTHKLRFLEAIHIHRNKTNIMNLDLGNVKSPLLQLFTEKNRERTIFDIDTTIFM